MKYIFILIIPIISSCSILTPQKKALSVNKQIKIESTIIVSDKEQYKLPSIVSRSGEKATIEVNPQFVAGSFSALQGYQLLVKPSFERDSLRTKGAFIIYHYDSDRTPKSQSVKFDFSSQSGQTVNIPIQIGYLERRKQLIIGVNSEGQDYRKESFVNVPPKKAILQLSSLKINATGQPIKMENKSQ